MVVSLPILHVELRQVIVIWPIELLDLTFQSRVAIALRHVKIIRSGQRRHIERLIGRRFNSIRRNRSHSRLFGRFLLRIRVYLNVNGRRLLEVFIVRDEPSRTSSRWPHPPILGLLFLR